MEKIGYLTQDRQERFNTKRGWFVNAWRILDANGKDLTGWFDTKRDARESAKISGIKLVEPIIKRKKK